MSGNMYDVIVVGAGSMGMSAGFHLAKRGMSTLLIDSFDPPHTHGSHHDEPRLIRHAYSGGPSYVALALKADRLWQELEAAIGCRLLVRSGVLNMSEGDAAFRSRMDDAASLGVRVEMLDSVEIRKRWPGLRLPETYVGMYEPDAGYLHSERSVSAYRQLALNEGAMLLPYTPVQHIWTEGGVVHVQTRAGVFQAEQAIVSVGAWFESLQSYVTLPIRAVRKTVGWFRSEPGLFDAGAFPGFTLGTDNGGYYGFPSIDGAGVKIGRHDGGVPWHPGEPMEPFGGYKEDEGDLRRTLETFMPLAAGALLRGTVCKYELTPDEHFIIDRHPAHSNVLLAGGFSGHGFKFSSAVGAILADLIERRKPDVDIDMFALSRFESPKAGIQQTY